MTSISFWQKLWRVEAVAIVSLIIYAGLVGLLFAADDGTPARSAIESMVFGGGNTLLLGLPAVVLYGAPIYTAHLHHRSFRFGWVIVLAMVPGAALVFLDQAMGAFAIVGGIFVALSAHFIGARWIARS